MPEFKPAISNTDDIGKLISRLRQLGEDWPSEPSLQHLSPQSLDILMKYMGEQKNTSDLLLLLLTAASFLFMVAAGTFGNILLAFPVVAILSIAAMTVYSLNNDKRYAVYALTQTNDLRVLSKLILTSTQRGGRHPEIRRAIKRLLAQVREEHAGLLHDSVQVHLWGLAVQPAVYEMCCDTQFALNALHALANVGNRSTLYRMQHLTQFQAQNAAQRAVVEAAQQLVPLMEARLQRQEVPQTLLRAADVPTSQPETLLRAAYATRPELQEQLLRATTSEQRATDA